jgi:two-component system chemotaxis response regulator CheY
MKILVVDDSSTMRGIEKRILEALGQVDFAEAADGVEALERLASGTVFGLALIDWNMPNMDGLTLVKRIRETDKSLPLVMVTTEADKARVVESIKAGVNNYVIKPFTPDGLLDKVRQTLSRVKAAA